MSRYSRQELLILSLSSFVSRVIYVFSEKLKKAQLLELVRRQPEVVFPRKIGSGPLESLAVRQLRMALSGPHGYTKATTPLEESWATDAATGARHEFINDFLSPLPSPSGSVFGVCCMFLLYISQ